MPVIVVNEICHNVNMPVVVVNEICHNVNVPVVVVNEICHNVNVPVVVVNEIYHNVNMLLLLFQFLINDKLNLCGRIICRVFINSMILSIIGIHPSASRLRPTLIVIKSPMHYLQFYLS